MKMINNCLICEKEFEPNIYNYRRGGGKYCSRACFYKSQIGKKRESFSDEWKQKMSEAHKGKHHSKESNEKNRLARLGKKLSEKTKLKLNKVNLGKKHSEETKRKMSDIKIKHYEEGKYLFFKETKIELAIENELRRANIKYQKQFGISGVGIVDFFLPDFNMIIECDGDYWHTREGVPQRDADRDLRASFKGYETLRFWEHEINESPKQCINKILKSTIREVMS